MSIITEQNQDIFCDFYTHKKYMEDIEDDLYPEYDYMIINMVREIEFLQQLCMKELGITTPSTTKD